ncbi:ribosome-inactivating family protein [Streptomyces sp. NPDC023838]|uniref:ribosome-inactivating family protein n=1 Tax=Streptomyces sp. NPDC023838 TaxID=3154325 RepID=UPI0033E5EACE
MRKEIPALLLTAALLTGVAPAAQAADGHAPAAAAATVRPQAVLTPYYWDFSQTDDGTVRSNYGQAVARLRTAVGHHLPEEPRLLETSDRADIATLVVILPGGRQINLHYTADNIYLRGFSVGQGTVVQFNDFDLGHEMDRSSRVLPFNGRYGMERGHLEYNSSRTRSQLTFERSTLVNQLTDLYNFANDSGGVSNQRVATAALTLAAATSEAARLQPVYQSILNAIPDGGDQGSQSTDNIVLENNWSTLTGFTRQLLRGEHPNTLTLGSRRFRNLQDARNVLVMLLSTKH